MSGLIYALSFVLNWEGFLWCVWLSVCCKYPYVYSNGLVCRCYCSYVLIHGISCWLFHAISFFIHAIVSIRFFYVRLRCVHKLYDVWKGVKEGR